MSTSAPIGIIGAGYIGQALAHALHERGRPFLAVSRSGRWRSEGTPEFPPPLAFDLTQDDPKQLRAYFSDCEAVVFCFAAGRLQDRRTIYCEGTRRVLEGLAALPLSRLIYCSATSALPERESWLDEDCTDWPDSERGRVQREAETIFIEHAEQRARPWIVLRLAGLFGPGRSLESIYRLHDPSPRAGRGERAVNLVHRDDVIAAILASLALPSGQQTLIHICGDEHPSRRQLIDKLAKERGYEAPIWTEESAPQAQIRGKRVDNKRMKKLLGLHPRASKLGFSED